MAAGWNCDQDHSLFAVSAQGLQSCNLRLSDIVAAGARLSCIEASCTYFVCHSCQVDVQMQANPSEADQRMHMQDNPSLAEGSTNISTRSHPRLLNRLHQFKSVSRIRSVVERHATHHA